MKHYSVCYYWKELSIEFSDDNSLSKINSICYWMILPILNIIKMLLHKYAYTYFS